MLFRAIFVLFLVTHSVAQSCTSRQYLTQKPTCEQFNAKCCTDGSVTAGTTGSISNGESPYPANSLCKWIIGPFSRINLRFSRFDTEKYSDGVILNSCIDANCEGFIPITKLSGIPGTTDEQTPLLNTDYTTTIGYMQIVFVSDLNRQRPGFAATWSVSGGYPVCTECPSNSEVLQTSGIRNLSSCVCNSGYVGPPGGPCTACASGKYKASPILCANCPFRSNSIAASSSCECSAGSEGNPFVACTDCPPGKYKYDSRGACVACPDGTFTSFSRSIECNECPKGTGPSADRTRCESCPDGTQISATFSGQCDACPIGFYSNIETNKRCVPCPSGFYSTAPRTELCKPCRACPDGYFRSDCTATSGGGVCKPCLACPPDLVNVGCMNRAGNSNQPGVCRNRTYVSRTPLCDQENSGLGLGGYTFLGLFGVSQDDASFQCRRRCDNQQNVLSTEVYKDNATFTDLLRQFPNVNGKSRAFNGGQCGGPYACNVANCNIPGSSDDSQTDYQPKLACPVYIEPAMVSAFWVTIDTPGGTDSSVVSVVNAMRETKCQTCALCGQGGGLMQDWGRGCARDCTQLSCQPGFIFDWTEPVQADKCKTCGDLDDIRLCLSDEQRAFDGYDVSGRLPKVYMKHCRPKRQLPLRGYEPGYGDCVKCTDFVDACAVEQDTYYHTCEESGTSIVATCKKCSRSNGRDPIVSRYWDGVVYRLLYCQQGPCAVSAGLAYTGVSTEVTPHRICHTTCKPIECQGGASQVVLPCILPHQRRCKDSINMDTSVNDAEFRAVTYVPAHSNILESNTTEPHLFASFENILVDHDAPTLSLRGQCVWNADFIPDNSVNPAGISRRFQKDCRAWSRNPRMQYPLMPLQNTVVTDATDTRVFPRRLLLNTSATAVAYSQGSIARPAGVFAGDIYLELDLVNTNNATLAAFVPNDRGIESVSWIPRWRASVYGRQLTGESMNLSVSLAPEQTCFSCFALRIFPQMTSSWTTINTTNAISVFRGDKFVFSPSPGLLVCESSVQTRVLPVFLETTFDASLTAMFASSLTDTCVSTFGIRSEDLRMPTDLVRSSDVIVSGECILYTFSSTRVYCVRRGGGVIEVSWQITIQGTIVDLAVYDGVLVRTVYSGLFPPGDTANYMSLISSVDSRSETVVQVAGLIMFARGAPRYFLRRTTMKSLRLSKFETQNNTFRFNASATYVQNDVKILFSRFVPVSAKNTLLEYSEDFIVFATAKYSGSRVMVYVSSLDITSVLLNTYSMPFAVFIITSGTMPEKIDDPYENIEYSGEALLSCSWLERRVVLLSVSVDGVPRGQFSPVILNLTDLSVIPKTLHPDLSRAFSAPFVRAAKAVLSSGVLLSCSECAPASFTSSSGFFAYGVSRVSYRRLIACDTPNTFIEEDATKSMPVKTCARVRYDSGNIFGTTMQMTLQCITMNRLEIVLELPPNHEIAFGNGIRYIAQEQTRLLLSVPCDNGKPLFLTAFDTSNCKTGCYYDLWEGGHLQIQGGITIESVRHRPIMSLSSETWDRLSLLQVGLLRTTYSSQLVGSEWRKYSVTVRKIAPLQQLDLKLQRDVSVAWLTAFREETQPQRVALDALAIVPVLSEHFIPVVFTNVSVLASIVYVPTVSDLRMLALETLAYGDDKLDWARVHASVHISRVTAELQQCSYVARVVAVDNNLQILTNSNTATTGCLVDFAQSAQCHVELPEKLTNQARVVGLVLYPATKGCRALSDADDISVEFAPFMRISQCPVNSFLHTDTLTCTACDTGEATCPSGKYVSGCRPLIHPSITPECLSCTAPNNSAFPNTSRGCSSWQCIEGFYRLGSSCARCSTLLTSVCRTTGGLRRQNCTAFENEKCIDCPPKPRYSEWSVSTSECTWRCKPGFFRTPSGCEACQTFDETVAFLAISGTRANGAFYRFQACSENSQTRAEVCVSGDFGFSLDGVYVADGRVFGEDCPLQCAENSNLHSVRVNLTRTGIAWMGQRCVTCAASDWPLFVNFSLLPRYAFEMSSVCVATCVRSAGFFAHTNRSRTCLFCPQSACAPGFFFSAKDNCAACQACTKTLNGGIFTASGTFDNSLSCPESCPLGHFTADVKTCRPHSVLACRAGLQYAVAGTPFEDARCAICADCSGAKEVAPCTTTSNRQCDSCGPIDTWSSAWSLTGCNLTCRTELGYTKLYLPGNPVQEICRKCTPCPIGRTLPDRPTNCTCQPCTVKMPPTAVYTKGCEWTCPLYHVARLNTAGMIFCEHTIRPISSVVNHLRSVSPVSCPPGQRLTQDQRPMAYASFACENCSTPNGMRIEDLNVTWIWDRSCAWQCAWGLDKQVVRGYFACETFRYTHKLKNTTTTLQPGSGLLQTHVIGIVVGAIVFVVFGMCFMCRML